MCPGPNKISLVEHHHVGEADLAQLEPVQSPIVPVREDPNGVDDAGDAVEPQQPFVPRIRGSHHDPLGVGYPAGLQNHAVDPVLTCEELLE